MNNQSHNQPTADGRQDLNSSKELTILSPEEFKHFVDEAVTFTRQRIKNETKCSKGLFESFATIWKNCFSIWAELSMFSKSCALFGTFILIMITMVAVMSRTFIGGKHLPEDDLKFSSIGTKIPSSEKSDGGFVLQKVISLAFEKFTNYDTCDTSLEASITRNDQEEFWSASLSAAQESSDAVRDGLMLDTSRQTCSGRDDVQYFACQSNIISFLASGTPNGIPPFELLTNVCTCVSPEPATVFAGAFLILPACAHFARRLRKKTSA